MSRDAAQAKHIFHQRIEASFSEISELGGRQCREAVTSMIIPVNSEAGRHQSLDQVVIAANVFAHAVGNLDDAAGSALAVPADTGDARPVCAGKSEVSGRKHGIFQRLGFNVLETLEHAFRGTRMCPLFYLLFQRTARRTKPPVPDPRLGWFPTLCSPLRANA